MQTSAMAGWPEVTTRGVELEFRTAVDRSRLALMDCSTFRFESEYLPVRGFPSFRGQRSYPGLWWFATTRGHVGYESWLERDHLMALDADPEVAGIASQPFRFHWEGGRHHTPDYFVRLRDGSAVVVDVRCDDQVTDTDAELFERSAAACHSVGWAYRRVGALDPVLAANLRWLSGYRHPRVYRAGIGAALESVFASARPLMAGVLSVGEAVLVLPVLFHLLWHGRLMVDMSRAALAESTVVSPLACS